MLISPDFLVHLLAAIPPTLGAFLAWWKAKETHIIVNSQRDAMLAKIEKLESTILKLEAIIKSQGR